MLDEITLPAALFRGLTRLATTPIAARCTVLETQFGVRILKAQEDSRGRRRRADRAHSRHGRRCTAAGGRPGHADLRRAAGRVRRGLCVAATIHQRCIDDAVQKCLDGAVPRRHVTYCHDRGRVARASAVVNRAGGPHPSDLGPAPPRPPRSSRPHCDNGSRVGFGVSAVVNRAATRPFERPIRLRLARRAHSTHSGAARIGAAIIMCCAQMPFCGAQSQSASFSSLRGPLNGCAGPPRRHCARSTSISSPFDSRYPRSSRLHRSAVRCCF